LKRDLSDPDTAIEARRPGPRCRDEVPGIAAAVSVALASFHITSSKIRERGERPEGRPGCGQVIGWSDTAGNVARHTLLYSDGTMTDLTQVVYDLFFVENFSGSGISADQIIGTGDLNGNQHAFILTVPKK
jgi:probable HAF family extracellular repeat protein